MKIKDYKLLHDYLKNYITFVLQYILTIYNIHIKICSFHSHVRHYFYEIKWFKRLSIEL